MAKKNEENQRETMDVEVLLYQKVIMRDGINLSTKIYRPIGKSNNPAILFFTPYVSDEYHNEAKKLARAGYAFVIADVRGRGDSEGEFFPLERDGQDGAELVEWIAKQPWCNGDVMMMGGSYRGMVQWQTLMHNPNSLKAISPAASVGPGIDFPQPKNIFYSFAARWLSYVSGKTRCDKLFNDNDYWNNKLYKLYSEHIPFEKLDEITGSLRKIFQRWLSHPEYDDYWKAMVPKPEDYKRINIPILTTTGYFDDDQHGAMYYYFNHLKYGNPQAVEKHYLLIGPWDHPGTRTPQKHLGGLAFSDVSVLNMNLLQSQWFDYHLKSAKFPELLQKRVTFYLLGDEKWLYADKIEDISIKSKTLYLNSNNGKANDVFASGALLEEKQDGEADILNYNPLQLMAKEEFFRQQNNDKRYTDKAFAYEKDIFIYHSSPFKEALSIAGYIQLNLYVELNVPDIDLISYIYEIKTDGTVIYLTESLIRAKYRNSTEKAELVVPGEINLFAMKAYYFFARTLSKGSRLRLLIKPLNTPEYEKNYCGGGQTSKETGANSKEAIIKIHHNLQYPSSIVLPVLNDEII